MKPRAPIVAFAALPPDMVSERLMPNLTAFAAAGTRFPQARSTFPTETRVNQAAIVTGCYPSGHGIVGNKLLDPAASPARLLDTGDEAQLAAADRRLGGRLVDVPVLGEILARHGRSLAVLSTGTPGGTRMLHHKAEQVGGFRLALHRPAATVPHAGLAALRARLGPIPEHRIPSNAWLSYAADCYMQHVEPRHRPDVMVLWFCEPDNSYHFRGLGCADNLAAIRHADAEFGRILAWRQASGLADELAVVTLSDHGQLTVRGESIDIAGQLAQAGFTVGETVAEGADAALALGNGGGVYVRDSDPGLTRSIVGWLQRQDWCGPVFTRAGADDGALDLARLGLAHRRAPDIALALRSDDRVNPHGVAGTTLQNAAYPDGGGLHGGLHRFELQTWLALSGRDWRRGWRSPLPAGNVDVLPTVLRLLGMDVPPWIHGRVLREAWRDHARAPLPPAVRQTFTACGSGGHRTHLRVSRVGASRYLDRAWADSGARA